MACTWNSQSVTYMSNDDCEKCKFKCLTLDNVLVHPIKYSCLKISKWCNIRISTVQSPSTLLNSSCHYYLCPIIDTLLIKKPYHIHLAMNLRAESKQNQIRSHSSNLVLTRTTRTAGNILFSTFARPRFGTIMSYHLSSWFNSWNIGLWASNWGSHLGGRK